MPGRRSRIHRGDPLLDGRLLGETAYGPSPITPGWFGAVQINAVAAHVTEQMFAYVGPFKPGIRRFSARLDFICRFTLRTGASRRSFSSAIASRRGPAACRLSYQFLNSTGSGAGTDSFGNPAFLQSRLNVNSADFQYSSGKFRSDRSGT